MVKDILKQTTVIGLLIVSISSWANCQLDTAIVTGTVTDVDGNVYKTVKIGNQWWMAENLKVTHYRNGDAVPNVTRTADWYILSTGAYCYYNNDANNATTYGSLYNWYAANDNRNIAPEGWHVPSDEEWKQLEMYLGMSESEADGLFGRGTHEGGKLIETGATRWSVFTALPGGYRGYPVNFVDLGNTAKFWSATETHISKAMHRGFGSHNPGVIRFFSAKTHGMSIRCVRD